MGKQFKKMSFISNRIVAFTVAAGLLGIFMTGSYFYQAVRKGAAIVPFVVMTVCFLLLISFAYFGIACPYLRWRHKVEQFLDGYLPFEEIDSQDIMLTPYTYLEEKKISEIATLVGYERQSSFSAAFHQRTGITPNEFRRQLGN